ncbi:MAG TPA: hypothetical protein VIA62_08940 [Thermoanaerobaculia bacterium]|jgi:hypothetical protein|nr:hypothetical protein [Thermoanaerobaculia bacterium]
MGGELLYLGSSALVKLVLPEAESEALLESLSAWPVRVTSELAASRWCAPPAAPQRNLRPSGVRRRSWRAFSKTV